MQRGAIIGLGNVALHGHLPGWRRRRDVEIVAVPDARPEPPALVSRHAPGAPWRPASAGDEPTGNWRVDPAVAGGGVLSDHGWHVFYIVQRWVGEPPVSVSARLERRRHTAWDVEDTASVRVAFPEATAEILLTWASDVRRNWAELGGTAGTLEL